MSDAAKEPFFDLSKLNLGEGASQRKSVTAKSLSTNFQEKRRKDALLKQQQARADRTHQARQLALQKSERQSVEPLHQEGDSIEDVPSESTLDYAKQLMQPEWMIEVPGDLSEQWYVMPRPDGRRCLLISSQGSTVSRLRNGRILHRFPSWLPNGSRGTQCGSDSFCILDCVFHEADNTYYLMDVMSWKGYSLYDCSAEFRLYWRETKLREETGSALDEHNLGCRYSITPVPAFPCHSDGLMAAHSSPMPFQRDGCYFLHKEGNYDTEGLTPLALLWKDAGCSLYFVDTDADGTIPQFQSVILRYMEDGALCTADEPPVPLGKLPVSFGAAPNSSPRPGRLMRFTIREKGLEIRDGELIGADLHFEGLGNQRRGRADTCSKIVFQHLARTQPIMLSHFTTD